MIKSKGNRSESHKTKLGKRVPCDFDILILLLAWRKKVQTPLKVIALPGPAIANHILNFETKTTALHSCIMLMLLRFPHNLATIMAA